jgi:RNA 2',3'-cyclic 3'-phosphodiesterase
LPDVRAFVAINLPEDIIQQLGNQIESISSIMPQELIRWVRESNIHLTLKFLGNVTTDNLDEITKSMKDIAAQHAAFHFDITSFGCFPDIHSPRTLWIGIRESSGELLWIQSDLEDALAGLGFSRERRKFHPHLTIGRVKRHVGRNEISDLAQHLKQIKIGNLGTVQVDKIALMRSDLRPTGAVYNRISVAKLREKA